jgi:hypothetical protein
MIVKRVCGRQYPASRVIIPQYQKMQQETMNANTKQQKTTIPTKLCTAALRIPHARTTLIHGLWWLWNIVIWLPRRTRRRTKAIIWAHQWTTAGIWIARATVSPTPTS